MQRVRGGGNAPNGTASNATGGFSLNTNNSTATSGFSGAGLGGNTNFYASKTSRFDENVDIDMQTRNVKREIDSLDFKLN